VARAVELLSVEPADRLLEIGCGGGAAVALICERLKTGTITAIDRSPLQVERATRRNAGHIAAGKATIRVTDIADVELEGEPFSKVFAINVNVFWVGPAAQELERIAQLLRPSGALHLFYEPPGAAKADTIRDKLLASMSAAGFDATAANVPDLLTVVARKRSS
jgi:cyclopropane fatty-acyl-phospholipid synthase-like methyltransferase